MTWTAREAISALYGYKLRRNHAIDDLINLTCKREALQLQFSELILETRIPAQADNWETREGEISREEKLLIIRRETLISYCDYNSLPEKFRTPAKWVQRASYNGLTIVREWKAIFPYSVKLNAVLSPQQELDYREFVDWLTRELEAPPKDLVCFAFNIHSERFEQTPDCGDLLAHIYSDLWMEEVADIEELLNKKIMVSWFLERCQAYKLDRKFLDWVSWVTRHPELISYLSGNERSRTPLCGWSMP